MRKLNTILSVLLLFICLLHGLMGSFMLLGISSGEESFWHGSALAFWRRTPSLGFC